MSGLPPGSSIFRTTRILVQLTGRQKKLDIEVHPKVQRSRGATGLRRQPQIGLGCREQEVGISKGVIDHLLEN